MKPCKDCPFRRKSRRGYVTSEKEREGTPEAAKSLLGYIEMKRNQHCHKNYGIACRGAEKFFENNESTGKHQDIFNNSDEFKSHHIFKEAGTVRDL